MTVHIRGGSVMGRNHFLLASNSQDSFAVRTEETNGMPLLVGVISDGCGSARRSEVGAHLTTTFLADALTEGLEPKLADRFNRAAAALLAFLRLLTESQVSKEAFVYEHLLATTLGFVSDGQKALIFSRGDGYIFLGENALELDENNQPNYLAYDIPKDTPASNHGFQFLTVDLGKVPRLALATDGFEPELIDLFWDKPHPNGVQRQLNALSRKKHFADDASIVTLEVISEEDSDEHLCEG